MCVHLFSGLCVNLVTSWTYLDKNCKKNGDTLRLDLSPCLSPQNKKKTEEGENLGPGLVIMTDHHMRTLLNSNWNVIAWIPVEYNSMIIEYTGDETKSIWVKKEASTSYSQHGNLSVLPQVTAIIAQGIAE